jgi:hypothetical protein
MINSQLNASVREAGRAPSTSARGAIVAGASPRVISKGFSATDTADLALTTTS